WVAAFKPHDDQAAPSSLDHHPADLFLRIGMHGFLLSDVNVLAILAGKFEQMLVGEIVVQHRIGDGEQLAALPSNQVGVAGPRSHPINLAHAAPYTDSRICFPPSAKSSSPSERPSAAASATGPVDSLRTI